MMNPAKPGKMKPGIQDENTPWTFLNELTELCVKLVFNSISLLLIWLSMGREQSISSIVYYRGKGELVGIMKIERYKFHGNENTEYR